MSKTTEKLITAAEVALRLGVSRRTVYNMVKAGTIAYVRPTPTSTRFKPSDIQAHIDRNHHVPRDTPKRQADEPSASDNIEPHDWAA